MPNGFVQTHIKPSNNLILISKSSIALVVMQMDGTAKITMKEKNPDGSQIIFDINEQYGTFTGRVLADN